MAKVKRYAYVSSPHSTVRHRFYGRKFVEGEVTGCGIRVQKGWPFWYGGGRHPKWGDILGKDCKRCLVNKPSSEPK